ncbi:MAG: MoxR family ATPase [Candidatus Jordarchaeales archaeon]
MESEVEIDVGNVQSFSKAIMEEFKKVIVGKIDVFENLLIALLCNGHVLLEGVPGVAKTFMAKTFARTLGSSFKRIQFTPDLLPSDIIGTYVFNQKSGEFEFRPGPIFANVILADEINRAPPKTQSALLEAMQERQVTVEGVTHPLPSPFIVIATQNPIETSEGVYPLPEAQLDRFLFKLTVDYPSGDEEVEILRRRVNASVEDVNPVVSPDTIIKMQRIVKGVYVAPEIMDYIRELVVRTRRHPQILLGGSPRASIVLMEGAMARAALNGRDYVIPDDVKSIAKQAFVHRIIMRPEAELEGVTAEKVVERLLEETPVPF